MWSLLLISLLSGVALGLDHATVFLSPAPKGNSNPPSLTAYESNIVLSSYLGVKPSRAALHADDYEGLRREKWALFLNDDGPLETGIGTGRPDSSVLLIKSDHPSDFIPLSPSFTISHPPEAKHFKGLLESYTAVAKSTFKSTVSSILDFGTSSEALHAGQYRQLLNDLDLSSSQSTALFSDEAETLAAYVENIGDARRHEFVGLELVGLSLIEAEHGRDSEVYSQACRFMTALLTNTQLKAVKLALIVHPATQSSSMERRAVQAESKSRRGVAPIYAFDTCFTEMNACTNSTNSCSGHGSCMKTSRGAKTCYTCACSPTTSKGYTYYWAGRSCDRRDVSSQFVLIAGATIFLVVLGIGSVSLLYSVGNVDLPNVLTASSTSHLKRD